MTKKLVVIPTYNESENIADIISDIIKLNLDILIVDDNSDIRNILNDLIVDAGYQTRLAANYNQALNEIDKSYLIEGGLDFIFNLAFKFRLKPKIFFWWNLINYRP